MPMNHVRVPDDLHARVDVIRRRKRATWPELWVKLLAYALDNGILEQLPLEPGITHDTRKTVKCFVGWIIKNAGARLNYEHVQYHRRKMIETIEECDWQRMDPERFHAEMLLFLESKDGRWNTIRDLWIEWFKLGCPE